MLHSQAVIALVNWCPVGKAPYSGLLATEQAALLRLSNTVEAPLLAGNPNDPRDDFLLGAAIKFIAPDDASGNLLFVSTPAGLARPAFFTAATALSTRSANVDWNACGCNGLREVISQHFAAAVEALHEGGFPAPNDERTLPLVSPLVEPGAGPGPTELRLVPEVSEPLVDLDFREDYRRSPVLRPGAKIYTVVARFPDPDDEVPVAEIVLRTPMRVSRWADENLYFAHPAVRLRTLAASPAPPLQKPVDVPTFRARAENGPNPTVRSRYLTILLVATGHDLRQVSLISGYTPADVAEAIRQFDEHGQTWCEAAPYIKAMLHASPLKANILKQIKARDPGSVLEFLRSKRAQLLPGLLDSELADVVTELLNPFGDES